MATEASPFLVTGKDAAGRVLCAITPTAAAFQEEWLQELLFRHPAILPISKIDEAFAPLIPIGREVANIDNLFISSSGLLTVVETKLWRNPEAHRTVVAQILEYAGVLTGWSYEKLEGGVKASLTRQGIHFESLYDHVKRATGAHELTDIEFRQRVQDGLGRGRFILLIAGDKIYPGATQLAEIIQSAPHMEFTFAFVELKCFKLEEDSDWPLVVVPSIVTRTKEVSRAVVKIVYEERKPEVEVSVIEDSKSSSGSTSFPEFIAAVPSRLSDIFQGYLDRWARAGLTIFWGKVGFSLRIPWNGKLVTVLDAYPKDISIFQDKRVHKGGFPASEYETYRESLRNSGVITSAFAANKRYLGYDQLTDDDVKLLLESTDQLAGGWKKAGTTF